MDSENKPEKAPLEFTDRHITVIPSDLDAEIVENTGLRDLVEGKIADSESLVPISPHTETEDFFQENAWTAEQVAEMKNRMIPLTRSWKMSEEYGGGEIKFANLDSEDSERYESAWDPNLVDQTGAFEIDDVIKGNDDVKLIVVSASPIYGDRSQTVTFQRISTFRYHLLSVRNFFKKLWKSPNS